MIRRKSPTAASSRMEEQEAAMFHHTEDIADTDDAAPAADDSTWNKEHKKNNTRSFISSTTKSLWCWWGWFGGYFRGRTPRSSSGTVSSSSSSLVVLLLLVVTHFLVGFSVYLIMSRSSSSVAVVSSSFSSSSSSSLSSSPLTACPHDMEHFANWFANTLDPKRKASFSDLRIETTAEVDENNQNRNNHKQQSNVNVNVKVWTPVPETYRKTFYYDGEKISMPIARALRSRGWTRVDTPEYAHLIYTYSSAPQLATALFPWQRFNYIPHIEKWNRKADFVYYYKQYYHRQQRRAQQQQASSSSSSTGTSTKTSTNVNRRMSMYVPESYMLNHNEQEILDFQKVLWDGEEDTNNDEPTTTRTTTRTAGKHYPWVHKLSSVNQGKGITILPPNSDALLRLPATSLQALRKNMKVEQKNDNSEEESHDSAAATDDDDDDTNTRQQRRRRRRKSSSNSNYDDETDDDDYTRSTEDEDENEESIIQRYICNEMTWTNQRKFDVRMYWFVASLDPLIVLYHDGYVRIGNGVYDESNFTDTTKHLTSHTGLGAEIKANFAQFEQVLNEKYDDASSTFQHQTKQSSSSSSTSRSRSRRRHLGGGEGLHRRRDAEFQQKNNRKNNSEEKKKIVFPNGNTPVEHVRNQFKHSLGELIEIMKHESFTIKKPSDYIPTDDEEEDGDDNNSDDEEETITSENSYMFYCADFIIDNDFDAWFIEPQNGCGLDEDYYFRLEMHASLFNGMVDILEEVGYKQEHGIPLLPLNKSGNWEVIYADGKVFYYDGYERSNNKDSCDVSSS